MTFIENLSFKNGYINRKKTLSPIEISAFCKQMGMIIRAGLPAHVGISILEEETNDKITKEFWHNLYIVMEKGTPLNKALKDTKLFPNYMLSMLEISEETGKLEDTLFSLANYYERESNIRQSIRDALFYPVVMIILMLSVIMILIIKILPIFTKVYDELGANVTGLANALLKISIFLNHYLYAIIALLVLFLTLLVLFYKTDIGKTFLLGGKITSLISRSRFANCMYLTIYSGLDIDNGIDLAQKVIHDPLMNNNIEACKHHIENGETFARALVLSNIFSNMYSTWLTIGFTTGSIEDVMNDISTEYENEALEKVNRLIGILEPSLVIIMTILIALILFTFITPLLAIMSSL
ncbi:type II secretion system F family protein [Lachnobacterium bovis]|uniref:Type IV pilus assembly protein PilC n=1 Tax=Lachnobacterium bovis TaxID=140626 RepID=A0A1H9TEM5_9FIRM|nr:type II secretion system F family protein [Lachnobacterium bovis]SER95497.1 type IV pilus assembly protein PilC [Lachnobacterium bovis]